MTKLLILAIDLLANFSPLFSHSEKFIILSLMIISQNTCADIAPVIYHISIIKSYNF